MTHILVCCIAIHYYVRYSRNKTKIAKMQAYKWLALFYLLFLSSLCELNRLTPSVTGSPIYFCLHAMLFCTVQSIVKCP